MYKNMKTSLTKHQFKVGPPSATLDQRYIDIGSAICV